MESGMNRTDTLVGTTCASLKNSHLEVFKSHETKQDI